MKKKNILKKIAPYFKTFSSSNSSEIDYIIHYEDENSCQKITLSLLQNIGTWGHYGNTGFRGWSALKKEDIVSYICQYTDLKKEEFKVLESHPSLFVIK